MKIFYEKTVSELKMDRNISDAREEIKKYSGTCISIKTDSWKNILKGITELQLFIKKYNENKTMENVSYFKSDVEEYIFYLTELEGKVRQKKLGVTPLFYRDKLKADQWRNKVSKIIHPDVCNHPKSDEAMSQLTAMYKEMTK